MLLLLFCCCCFFPGKMVPRDFSSFGNDCYAFEQSEQRNLHFSSLHKILSEEHTAEILKVGKMMP